MEKAVHCVYNNMKSMTKKLDKVRNTVKGAVLEGDIVAIDFLAISFFYDTKPV